MTSGCTGHERLDRSKGRSGWDATKMNIILGPVRTDSYGPRLSATTGQEPGTCRYIPVEKVTFSPGGVSIITAIRVVWPGIIAQAANGQKKLNMVEDSAQSCIIRAVRVMTERI